MELQPSLSVLNGKTTRLTRGDYSNEKEYEVSPIDVARHFEEHGVEKVHLVDLDGAKRGEPVNYDILHMIMAYTELKVNFTGGVHTDGDTMKAFEFGAESITAATISVYNRELFSDWIMSYGREKIHLGADVLDHTIRVGGWQKDSEIDVFDHIGYYYDKGLKYVKTTDISRDGLLEGPAFDLYAEILAKFPHIRIYASGGIRNMDDILKLQDIGVHGVIFGKAYYEGRITLKEIDKFFATRQKAS